MRIALNFRVSFFVLCLSMCFMSVTTAIAQQWCAEDKEEQNSYVVEVTDGVFDFSFVFNNGQQIR